jgi:DNA invertase Pin-like site-specific DNA recombinase
MAMVAEEEGRMISERTKQALAAARRRGVQLGGYNKNPMLTPKARKAGQEANARMAAQRATDSLQSSRSYRRPAQRRYGLSQRH